ncbi:MAG: hypothetical protein R3F24_10510 [Gammaproteobacteria bacterium]
MTEFSVARLAVVALAGILSASAWAADDDAAADAARQAELDHQCEAAREEKLAPIREDIFQECLDKKRGDEAFCRRDADGYNGNRPGGAPRFYELPECEAAFKFRTRARR